MTDMKPEIKNISHYWFLRIGYDWHNFLDYEYSFLMSF